MRMRKAAIALISLFAAVSLNARAGSVAGTGGSTEITQLLNHVELITQSSNTLNTVRNTLQSAMSLQQSLQQLDPSTLANLSGLPMDQLNQMMGLYSQVNNTLQAYQYLQSQMQSFKDGVQYTGMSPMQYLKTQAYAAQRLGGAYQTIYQGEMSALQNANQQQTALQQSVAAIPGVTGQVQGLQQVLSLGAQQQAKNLQVLREMQLANTMASMKAQNDANDMQARATAAQTKYQNFVQSRQAAAQQSAQDLQLPDPTQINLTGANKL